jgi:hypothetical protein
MPAALPTAVLLGCLQALPEQSDTSTTFLSKADEWLMVFHDLFGAKLPACICLQKRHAGFTFHSSTVGVSACSASAAGTVRHQDHCPKQIFLNA